MTALIGILCKDGVVIGADSSTTSSGQGGVHIVEQKTQKIEIIENNIIIAGCGSVGCNQRFIQIVKGMYENKEFSLSKNSSYINIGKKLSRKGLEDFLYTHNILISNDKFFNYPFGYGALVSFPFDKKPYLCEFNTNKFQPEFKDEKIWYVSMGSSQHITDTFLALMREIFWQDAQPTCEDAIFNVYWTLDFVIKINPGGINEPINIAVLKDWDKKGDLKAKIISSEELEEHRENVNEIIEYIRKYKEKLKISTKTQDIPNFNNK